MGKNRKMKNTFNQKEAAKYLGVTRQTLQNWLRKGVAPKFVLLGVKRAFHKSDLNNFKKYGVKNDKQI